MKKKKRAGRGLDVALPAVAGGGHQKPWRTSNTEAAGTSGPSAANADSLSYWPTEGWKVTSPEAQGMDSAAIERTIEAFRERQVRSVAVVRNGCLVAEHYSEGTGADKPQNMYSVTKSITSALAGIALADRKLKSVDQRLADFFPELNKHPLKSQIRIKHLLSMTSGLEWADDRNQSSEAMMYSPDWIRTVLEQPQQYPPGSKYNYSNGDAHLMSAVLHKATGQPLLDYAKSRLFAPLGITNVLWNSDPQGYSIGAWAMALTLRDMAKIGLLYLKGGLWEGRTVIPKRWIRESLMKRAWLNYPDGSQGGYGYFWWLKPLAPGLVQGQTKQYDTFYAAGSFGQRIFVVPALQLIVAATAYSSDVEMPEQLLNGIIQAIKSV
ncbi:serine hydrolase domain-containing protein [Gordoniibacillus kamchatkensis]|uniref:serine hydrolase domain-containing protein n=1 Tax=Gordoniibacillus kamchatkensis TaxID=1590651 RepID=UPI0006961A41|nr:serine hydrolase [Paenibacillus sp. VKM B-2647]